MDNNLHDILYYRLFRLLFDQYLKEFYGDTVNAFCRAIVESAKAEIRNPRALGKWARKYARFKGRLQRTRKAG